MVDDKLNVLVIDDELSIRRFLKAALNSKGYTVWEAEKGEEGISLTINQKPDLIILDLGLPDIDGVEVTRLLRKWTRAPIIILSVKDSDNDKIAALDAGADDYLTKPFSLGELTARLRANLRRLSQIQSENIFVNGDLKVDMVRRVVNVGVREIQLTPNEYDLLKVLVSHSGRVLTHNQLLREVWGTVYSNEFHILHVNISNLRRKIESDPARPQYIITEPGVGYRLKVN
jgi:two-component system, OmpR family, KDP operon response regulator KdpE